MTPGLIQIRTSIFKLEYQKKQQVFRQLYVYLHPKIEPIRKEVSRFCFNWSHITIDEKNSCSAGTNELLDLIYNRPEYIDAFLEFLSRHEAFRKSIGTELQKALERIQIQPDQPEIAEDAQKLLPQNPEDRIVECKDTTIAIDSESAFRQNLSEFVGLKRTAGITILLIGVFLAVVTVTHSIQKPSDNRTAPSGKVVTEIRPKIIYNDSFNPTSNPKLTDVGNITPTLLTLNSIPNQHQEALIRRTTSMSPKSIKYFKKPSTGLTIDFFTAARQYQTAICNSIKKRVTLSINSTTLNKNLLDYIPNCPENVNALDIIGPVSISDLLLLLYHFSNIDSLTIRGKRNCDLMENDFQVDFDVPQPQAIVLTKLTFLEFQNINECSDLYKLVAVSVKTPSLLRIDLDNAVVTKSNQYLIEEIVRNNMQLKYFSFKGSICDHCQSFTNKEAWSRIFSLFELY